MGLFKNTHPLIVTLKNDSEEITNNNTRVIPTMQMRGKLFTLLYRINLDDDGTYMDKSLLLKEEKGREEGRTN